MTLDELLDEATIEYLTMGAVVDHRLVQLDEGEQAVVWMHALDSWAELWADEWSGFDKMSERELRRAAFGLVAEETRAYVESLY